MENSALLSAIIENAIDGIITIDEWGKIESINPSACQLFDYLATEVIGRNISMLMPVPSMEQPVEYANNYEQTEIARMIGAGREVTGLKKNGIVFPFRLGLSAVQYSGRRIYTGFLHDLSREKAAEQTLKEYTAGLEQLVAERTQALEDTVVALERAKEERRTKSSGRGIRIGQRLAGARSAGRTGRQRAPSRSSVCCPAPMAMHASLRCKRQHEERWVVCAGRRELCSRSPATAAAAASAPSPAVPPS